MMKKIILFLILITMVFASGCSIGFPKVNSEPTALKIHSLSVEKFNFNEPEADYIDIEFCVNGGKGRYYFCSNYWAGR